MASDGVCGDTRPMPLVAGGRDEALDGWDERALGFAVRVREVDHRAEAASREILADVMAGRAEGTFSSDIHYKGRREGYWMQCLSPDVLGPRYFGLFSSAGVLLGWFSLTFTLSRPELATLGIMVKAPWRDRGLGTAAIRHAIARKDSMLARPIGALLVTTKPDNGRVIHIARKLGLHDLGMVVDGATGAPVRVFATSPVKLK